MNSTTPHLVAGAVVAGIVTLGALEVRPTIAPTLVDRIRTAFAPPTRETRWTEHLALVHRTLAASDVSAGVRAWHDAYGAALGSGQWQAMLAVGDAWLRLGDAAAVRDGAKANARLAYVMALSRARRAGTVDGALRVARAFAALGDREASAQCVQIARWTATDRNDQAGLALVREYAGATRSGGS